MAQLKYCDKHNQVGFLLKPTESAGYTEIVDFLRRSKLRYALTHNPPIYDSLVKQFWQTATARTLADGTQQLNATIDTIEYTITEESVRRQLQLADASGIHMLQNEEIFAGLQNIGEKQKLENKVEEGRGKVKEAKDAEGQDQELEILQGDFLIKVNLTLIKRSDPHGIRSRGMAGDGLLRQIGVGIYALERDRRQGDLSWRIDERDWEKPSLRYPRPEEPCHGRKMRGDGVTGINRRHHDLYGDGIRNLATASGRGRLKEDLESSTWRQSQDFKATPSQ
ncbi:hypothetical protein Tco_0079694 [Tanacetum coccineum]